MTSSAFLSSQTSGGCVDALLWIGSSYPKFRCFVHEAEARGISRRLPSVHRWMVPGLTRIFLVHGEGLPRDMGRIYGYFVLGRTEVLTTDPADVDRSENWVPIDPEPAALQPGGCHNGEVRTMRCPDGSQVEVAECVDGQWTPTGAKCPTLVPIPCEEFKPPRKCPNSDGSTHGLRTTPGAVYAVDEFDAAISDVFCPLLVKEGIHDEYQRCDDAECRRQVMEGAHSRFWDCATSLKRPAALPGELADVAEVRGRLVLFREPPIYEAYPQASFRGTKRIDGAELIGQVHAGVDTATVTSCTKRVSQSMTTAGIVNTLASQLHMSQAMAGRCLARLQNLTQEEVFRRGVLRLTRLGTFRVPGTAGARSITQRELENRLACALHCRDALAHSFLGAVTALARDELRAGHDFRLHQLGTLHRGDSRVTFCSAKAVSDSGAVFRPSTTL